MGYIEGFKYDIFISYSHIDNEKTPGTTYSWIELFYEALVLSLWQSIGTKKINIWWDNKRLDGGVAFDDAIEKGIKDSAIFLCLNSPSFLNSDYCQKELDLFYKKAHDDPHGFKVKDRPRIINVLLYNIPYTKWPYELNGTPGFSFHDGKDDDDKGDPVAYTATDYKERLHNLRDALVALIEILRKPPPPPEDKFTIFFGEVPDTLRSLRSKTINALKEADYSIVADMPPPYQDEEHEHAVNEALENSMLSVHLLDQYPGHEILEAPNTWYTKKQAELSLASAKNKLIWVPGQLNLHDIEEEPYKRFLSDLDSGNKTANKLDFVRGAKSELITQVKDIITRIIREAAPLPIAGQLSVLLDTHIKDQLFALELSKTMVDKNIQPYINPQDDDPHKNINMLEDRISLVSKLIFFYGKVSKEWVIERMNAALQIIVEHNYAVDDFIVIMLPPHKDSNDFVLRQRFLKVNVFNYSDQPMGVGGEMDDFFNKLKS